MVRKVQQLGNIVNLDTGAYHGRGHRWPGEGGLSIVRVDVGWSDLKTAIDSSKNGKGLLLG
ncbi:Metallophosphoesterase [Pseudomonas amygdali pv. lachrymans]|uniref:Metallophosphoesterase n=1 Tax=Pseudomonas amygdali pv. lachrymans TaxID=53707 RepID=A0ABR5KRR2_PSEAV|nr:Metallophosphoesterase [Pseudomonas amygdali pv. lachrymans]